MWPFTKAKNVPLCINCKYCKTIDEIPHLYSDVPRRLTGYETYDYYCFHPKNKSADEVSVITGVITHGTYGTCKNFRQPVVFRERCTPEGNYFESKVQQ